MIDWHLRMHNWAIWARSDGLNRSPSLYKSPGPSINDKDAEQMEVLLLRLKQMRPPLFKALFLTYLARKSDLEASRRMHVTPERYDQLIDQAFKLLAKLESNSYTTPR